MWDRPGTAFLEKRRETSLESRDHGIGSPSQRLGVLALGFCEVASSDAVGQAFPGFFERGQGVPKELRELPRHISLEPFCDIGFRVFDGAEELTLVLEIHALL